MQEIEFFVLIDENGEFAIHADETELQTAYDEGVGTATGELAMRKVHVKLTVPLPRASVVEAKLPAEPEEAAVSVK